jgi:periplasmic copper chaperone A
MTLRPSLSIGLACFAAAAAHAHVTLPPGGATAGTVYPAAFRVGHACKDAAATTAIKVRVPAGFTPLDAPARPGWAISVTPTEVSWTASTPQAALPAKERTSFVVRGQLAATPATLWFKVLQVCDNGSADWAEVPAREGDKPEFPAARLDVLPPGVAPVDVRDAWARSTVEGQRSTGVYARLSAPAGARFVGASSPWAETVEVHEMKMVGDVMRMRALDAGLELPPGESVELQPGGYHVMVMGLKRVLPAGSALPITLRFVDRDGRAGELSVQVPARAAGPAAGAEHKHGK